MIKITLLILTMTVITPAWAESAGTKSALPGIEYIQDTSGNPGINFNRLAQAIYKAEGGAKTAHPYGILAKYKHTTPKQACLNTISRRFKAWDGKGDFIRYLGQSYAPVGALNDPTGLNRNWVKNVSYLYNMGEL